MKYKTIIGIILLLVIVAACERGDKAAQRTGRSEATPAYADAFGPPPTVAAGECFAVAGYLPHGEKPERVIPVPLFLFAREGREELVIRHLIALDPRFLPPEVSNPFPPGTVLDGISRQDATIEIALTVPGGVPEEPAVQGIASSLAHTLAQFPEITRVRVTANGRLLPNLAPEGIAPLATDIEEPGPPRLLGVAGVWEEGEQDPEEVLVLYDRPVQVREITLTTEEGRPLAGELYQSMFDMAVVLHPAEPAEITPGMPLRVAWQATDRKGRTASGEGVYPVERQEEGR